jgi:nucleoside-diphosphate-sugar epimerase
LTLTSFLLAEPCKLRQRKCGAFRLFLDLVAQKCQAVFEQGGLDRLQVLPILESVPVNVCSGEPHTVGELAVELSAAYGGPAPLIVGGARSGDVRHVVASPDRARTLLGFHARMPFAQGVKSFATDPLRGQVEAL